MGSAGDVVLVMAPMFHNVNFAAGGPAGGAEAFDLPVGAGFVDVFTQHPDGGPGADASGQFGAYLYSPVGESELRVEAGRGVLLGEALISKGLIAGSQVEYPVNHFRILDAVCVVLNFAVEPTATSGKLGLVKPLVAIN